jgi:hypothetical protein
MVVKYILNNLQSGGAGGSSSVLGLMKIADIYVYLKLKHNTCCSELLN